MQTNINENIHTAEPNQFTQALEDKLTIEEAIEQIMRTLETMSEAIKNINQRTLGLKGVFFEFLEDNYSEYLKDKQDEASKILESLNRNTEMETPKI